MKRQESGMRAPLMVAASNNNNSLARPYTKVHMCMRTGSHILILEFILLIAPSNLQTTHSAAISTRLPTTRPCPELQRRHRPKRHVTSSVCSFPMRLQRASRVCRRNNPNSRVRTKRSQFPPQAIRAARGMRRPREDEDEDGSDLGAFSSSPPRRKLARVEFE